MYKKIIALTATIAFALSLCGCSNDNADKFYGKDSSSTSDGEDTSGSNLSTEYSLDVPDYRPNIELYDYVGLEYYINESLYEITDDMVLNNMCGDLSIALTDVTDRGAQYGDTITVTFAGTIDGKEFEGSSATNYKTILGEGKLSMDFEEQILGVKAGETTTINYTFAKTYADESIAGKTAEFELTLVDLKAYDKNEITDAIVSEKTKYSTVDEYETAVRTSLEQRAAEQKRLAKATVILQQISDNSKVTEYDEDQINDLVEVAKKSTLENAKAEGMDNDTYVQTYYGSASYEEYEKDLDTTAREYMKSLMIISAISYNENLSVTDEEYQNQIKEYVEAYGISELELSVYYTSEDIIFSILMTKVQNWLIDNAVLLDAPVE